MPLSTWRLDCCGRVEISLGHTTTTECPQEGRPTGVRASINSSNFIHCRNSSCRRRFRRCHCRRLARVPISKPLIIHNIQNNIRSTRVLGLVSTEIIISRTSMFNISTPHTPTNMSPNTSRTSPAALRSSSSNNNINTGSTHTTMEATSHSSHIRVLFPPLSSSPTRPTSNSPLRQYL
ncbi:hypothetical protein VTK26DRAFT_1205 [Humicola hyalothermophila]